MYAVVVGLSGNHTGFFEEFEIVLKSILLNGPMDNPFDIHLICDVSGAKCYKELSQKINNMSIVREYRNNENIGKALAFNYDDGQQDKKGHYYDEDKILQYPLKEYADNTSMCQDLGQLITELLGSPDWEKYRNVAYQLWKSTRVAKQKTEKEERIGMYDYLDVEVLEKLIKKEDEYSDYERPLSSKDRGLSLIF